MCWQIKSFSSLQSWIWNKQISQWRVRSVGAVLWLIICKAGWLSIWIIVGCFCSNPNYFNTICKYRVSFPAVWAAINSASVELPAVTDWVFDLYTIAALQNVNTTPEIDLLFRKSIAWDASTKQWRISTPMLILKTCSSDGSLGIE